MYPSFSYFYKLPKKYSYFVLKLFIKFFNHCVFLNPLDLLPKLKFYLIFVLRIHFYFDHIRLLSFPLVSFLDLAIT